MVTRWSPIRIVTKRRPATAPAKCTTPDTGARIVSSARAVNSIVRRPGQYGHAGATKGCAMGPDTGAIRHNDKRSPANTPPR